MGHGQQVKAALKGWAAQLTWESGKTSLGATLVFVCTGNTRIWWTGTAVGGKKAEKISLTSVNSLIAFLKYKRYEFFHQRQDTLVRVCGVLNWLSHCKQEPSIYWQLNRLPGFHKGVNERQTLFSFLSWSKWFSIRQKLKKHIWKWSTQGILHPINHFFIIFFRHTIVFIFGPLITHFWSQFLLYFLKVHGVITRVQRCGHFCTLGQCPTSPTTGNTWREVGLVIAEASTYRSTVLSYRKRSQHPDCTSSYHIS